MIMYTNICLKTYANRGIMEQFHITLTERLPRHLSAPCIIHGSFIVHAEQEVYRIVLDTHSVLSLCCLRCAEEYQTHYVQQTSLIVCLSEQLAARYMAVGDCIVLENPYLNLIDILTDELHLFAPEKHIDVKECS